MGYWKQSPSDNNLSDVWDSSWGAAMIGIQEEVDTTLWVVPSTLLIPIAHNGAKLLVHNSLTHGHAWLSLKLFCHAMR